GGIYARDSDLRLMNNTIMNNSAYSAGGGIFCHDSSPAITNNTIMYNNAGGGGGIHCYDSNPTLTNNTIAYNNAFEGGGIYCDNSSPSFDSENRCNIYLNHATVGRDLYTLQMMEVIVDTFTVMNPTDAQAYPIENYSFDILDGRVTPINADLYVSPDGDDANSGLSPDDPLRTIHFALTVILANSLNPHTIYLADGIYSSDNNGEFFPISPM
ncbi:MAG: hypothetical protein GY839_09570, partial [candidate division Zixibacteria bacterium]|nr:hypothetical protein [candidate division Zixibacteria bacterium]